METSLHRDLKARYAGSDEQSEVRLDGFRIDAVSRDSLIEVQHGSLAAIRDKVRVLVKNHRVIVVKPIIVRKVLVKQECKGGPVVSRRLSPKCGKLLDVFDELIHFTRAFPHPSLTLEILLVDTEEWRFPGHGRRRRWRANDFQVEDQKLTAIHSTHRLRTAGDLLGLIGCRLSRPFHTGQLAESLEVDRWIAQRIAYCLRQTGAVREVGKQGNARLYEVARTRNVS